MPLQHISDPVWTEELIDFYATCDKMCRYIDMPLQHISDPVLKRMNVRATTRQKTLDLLARLRVEARLQERLRGGWPSRELVCVRRLSLASPARPRTILPPCWSSWPRRALTTRPVFSTRRKR